jgi:hypothetical protein
MSVSCKCCVLSGRGLRVECGPSECDHEAAIMSSPGPVRGCCATGNEKFMVYLTAPSIASHVKSLVNHQFEAVRMEEFCT